MKRVYHSVFLRSLVASGCFHLIRACQRQYGLILMYHGVLGENDPLHEATNNNHVEINAFIWQMEFLKEHYTLISLEEFVKRLRGGAKLNGLAAITIDDGYRNIYSNASPILVKLGIPATIFLITGLVGTSRLTWYDTVEVALQNTQEQKITLEDRNYDLMKNRRSAIKEIKAKLKTMPADARLDFIAQLVDKTGAINVENNENYRLMNWEEVQKLHSNGMSFGVHTYSHPNLPTVAFSDLEHEIDGSTHELADRLSAPIEKLCFSYPDGDYNRLIRNRVETLGLYGAVAVKNALVGPNADPFAIPRVAVDRHHTSAIFEDATVGFTRGIKRLISR